MPKTRTSHLPLIISCFFLAFFAHGQQSDISSVLECIEQDGTNCKNLLDMEVNRSRSNSNAADHFGFLIETSINLAKLGEFELALHTCRKAYRESKPKSTNRGKAAGTLSAVHLYAGSLDSALFYSRDALLAFRGAKDSVSIAKAHINIGQIRKEKGDFAGAMGHYVTAISMFKHLGNPKLVARSQSEIAVLFAVTGNVEKAIENYKAAAAFYQSSGDEHFYAYTILNMANDLIYMGREDTALVLLNEVIPVFEKENDIYLLMNAEAQLGRALSKLGRNREGIAHLEKSNQLGAGQNFIAQIAYNEEYLALIYSKMGLPREAVAHATKAYQLHRQLGLNEDYLSAVMDLATAYESAGQADSALKYTKEAFTISDTLFTIEKEQQLDELKTKYESDLKEEQIKAGKAEIEVLSQRNRAQRNRAIALGLGFATVFLLAVWVISRQRVRMAHNRKIAEERDKTLRAELSVKSEEQKRLKVELDHKVRELTSQALLIAEKNEMMFSFKERLQEISEKMEENTAMNQLVRKIERVESKTEDWDKFMQIFKEVHPEFLSRLKSQFTGLTSNDLRLLALMRMNFSNKEIASILHISDEGLKKARYRLRKKLDLPSEENMQGFIMGL